MRSRQTTSAHRDVDIRRTHGASAMQHDHPDVVVAQHVGEVDLGQAAVDALVELLFRSASPSNSLSSMGLPFSDSTSSWRCSARPRGKTSLKATCSSARLSTAR